MQNFAKVKNVKQQFAAVVTLAFAVCWHQLPGLQGKRCRLSGYYNSLLDSLNQETLANIAHST